MLSFDCTEKGDYYYLIMPLNQASPTKETVQRSLLSGTADFKNNDISISLSTLKNHGEAYKICIVAVNESFNVSNVLEIKFGTIPLPPLESDAVIDYKKETISYNTSKFEMSTTPDNFKDVLSSGADISRYIGSKLYIRVKENGYLPYDEFGKIPASQSTMVNIPSRPKAPNIDVSVTDDGFIVNSIIKNLEYSAHLIGGQSEHINWQQANTFKSLQGKDYHVNARVAATNNTFKSDESSVLIKTKIQINPPSLSGDGAAILENNATRDKTVASVGG